jgi:hypothetical protein
MRKMYILMAFLGRAASSQVTHPVPVAYTVVMDEVTASSTIRAHKSTQQIRATRMNGDSVVQNTILDPHDESRAISVQRRMRIGNLAITSYDFAHAKSTMKLSDDEMAAHRADRYTPESDCTRTANGWPADSRMIPVVAGREKIAGIDTIKLKSGNTTDWRAPALGCEVVQYMMAFEAGSISVHRPSKITIGEPDESLFTISATYTEAPPSQAFTMELNHRQILQGLAIKPTAAEHTFQTHDQQYYSHRP